MTPRSFYRAQRRAVLLGKRLDAVTSDVLKMGRRGIRRFLSTHTSGGEQVRPGEVLHPTKGWRPYSNKRSAASVLTNSMRTGQMPFSVPPKLAQATMQAANGA